MSTDRRLPVTEYHGNSPCIEPHVLGRILDNLEPLRAKLRDEENAKADGWGVIDRLEAARQ